MANVYRKTPQGQAEMSQRTRQLAPRLRAALIVVDGKRDEHDLARLIGNEAEATLRALLDAGLIEVTGETRDEPPAGAARPAVNVEPPKGGLQQKAFEQHRAAAVRTVNDLLGPPGETAAVNLERCKTWDELLAALESVRKVIATARGAGAAADFARNFIDSPPR